MKLHFLKITYFLPVLAAILLFLMFSLTTPLSAGPGGILTVFFLMYVFWASTLFIILHAGLGFVGKLLARKQNVNIRNWQLGVRRSYYIASVLAFAPVLLLAIQSVGQLQVRDVILVVVLIGLLILYVLKRS